MATEPEERREKEKEQRRADVLLKNMHGPGIAVIITVFLFFVYVSLLRAGEPSAFLPAFLIGTVVTILGIAFVITVMIRKNI